ncbi:bacterial low temperature requirement A protein-domain-containing protein [Poronia punctata]|nr:bacterial low temperature requirement A protein-domain-containing protein [Poronia punctata]
MSIHGKTEDINPHLLTDFKLKWIANPIVPEDKIRPINPGEYDDLQLHDVDDRRQVFDYDHIPRFHKKPGSDRLEVFYDLWFVANLAVFTSLHTVNDETNLLSYVAYISLLWFDWFQTSLYDVRFLADSVFERVARALHMGVMVGFAVVSVNFTPDEQKNGTFQVTSLVLMVSRLVLAVRYLSIAWHIRHFKQGKKPLFFLVAMNFLAALIYMGVSFRFQDGKNSRAYGTWYAISAIESLLQVGLSLYFKVLSFDGTHLTERMTVATLFMLGEGVNVLGENVVTIVQNSGWTAPTIGNLTAGVAHVYFVYMIYFDWMSRHHTLTGFRQALWTLIHLPFHIVLLLFSEGASQFIQWWKISESIFYARDKITHGTAAISFDGVAEEDFTQTVVAGLQDTVQDIWAKYAPSYIDSQDAIDSILDDISKIPNDYWYGEEYRATVPSLSDYDAKFETDIVDMAVTVCNTIFQSYKIDPLANIAGKFTVDTPSTVIQNAAFEATSTRFEITFNFTFIAAGLTLLIMVLLYAVARPRSAWSWSVGLRMALFGLTGVGLALVTLVSRDEENQYPLTPWLLPTLTLVFFIVAVLSHFPRGPPTQAFDFLRRRRRGRAMDDDDASGGYGHLQEARVPALQAYEGHHGYGGQPTQIYTAPTVPHGAYDGARYGKTF